MLLAASAGLAQDRAARLSERARQDREIVYFLQPPETHAFDLYHDLTESREGVDKYLNVVRAGSTVTNPKAVVLDTGETLPVETLKGEAIAKAAIDIGEPVRPESEVVVIRFPKIAAGQTLRLRISETYTDPGRYRLEGEELVFDRTLRATAQRGGAARGLLPDQLLDPGHACPRPGTGASVSTSRTRARTRSPC